MTIPKTANAHRDTFFDSLNQTQFFTSKGPCDMTTWASESVAKLLEIKNRGSRLYFIGNGASAAMSSHFATDFTKNGNCQAYSLTDGALMTCFSNDYSYEDAYREMFKRYFKKGDAVVAISSSGNSKNIIRAVMMAKEIGDGQIFGFSGFKPDNNLRSLSNYGVYVPNMHYGFVESAHSYYLHMLIDYVCEHSA